MPGFVPNEGETLFLTVVFKRSSVDRDADLELGLFTNVGIDETITLAGITEPVGTGYARITLVDATWSIIGDISQYPQQVFTGGAGGWAGAVQGYFIATKSAGGTQRLLAIEVDANGPYTIIENATYKVTPFLIGE